jgi:transposase InsO family protein
LSDNGKVFTARFGPGPGPVLFDRICIDNGITHILTALRSPTATGKIERWHKTLRREFLDGKVCASIEDAQAQLDAWVHHYNYERPHQSIGGVAPIERFASGATSQPFDRHHAPRTAMSRTASAAAFGRRRSGRPTAQGRMDPKLWTRAS